MAGHKDDGDSGKYFVISKVICVEFKKVTSSLKRLDAIFNGDSITAKFANVDGLTHRWTLDKEICLFPKFNDSLILRAVSKPERRPERRFLFRPRLALGEDNFKFGPDVWSGVADSSSTPIRMNGPNYTLILEVTAGYIEDILATGSIEELDPLKPERVQDVITSSDSFLKNARPFRSILENMPIIENVLRRIEGEIGTLGDAGDTLPLAKAVLIALRIPYEFLANETEFKEDVTDLTKAMLYTCNILMNVEDPTKITSANGLLLTIMSTLREVAGIIDIYRRKGLFGQVISARFRSMLEYYAEKLISLKNEFQIATIAQISGKVDSEAFLRMHLDIVEQESLSHGCVKGTRDKILQEVRDWLHDYDSAENILWIVGAPGTGKSTIATTIAKELPATTPLCARFFYNRDVPHLRDPRQIWSTLAYQLAKKDDGVKAALMAELGKMIPRPDYSTALEQFEKLIQNPLETAWKETNRTKAPHPLIIIDALDECDFPDEGAWLESLACWSKLPGAFKLIVTSRDLPDTHAKPSYFINLTMGDEVTEDSIRDIETFFTTKFAELRRSSGLENGMGYRFGRSRLEAHRQPSQQVPIPPTLSVIKPRVPVGFGSVLKRTPLLRLANINWPKTEVVKELTNLAAGLFIWAHMVIQYVSGGSDPAERLEEVLRNIRGETEIGDLYLVDHLYAGIISEAFQKAIPDERKIKMANNLKRVLATVVLAKESLRKDDLPKLLSIDPSDSSNILQILRSVIRVSDADEVLVRHKLFSDFLLDHKRSLATMSNLDQESSSESYRATMAIACLRIMVTSLTFNACGIKTSHCLNKDIQDLDALISKSKIGNALIYACRFWAEHLNDFAAESALNKKELNDEHLHSVQQLLDTLLSEKLLFWLEILSLVKAIPSAEGSLSAATRIFKGRNDDLTNLAEDAGKFVRTFEEPIAAAAPHIYLSALPFCPSDSLVAKKYRPQYLNLLCVTVMRGGSDWVTACCK